MDRSWLANQSDPATQQMPPTMRVRGAPMRVETDPAKGVTFLTLEAARHVLEALLRHPEGQTYNTKACQRLLVWLRGYPQVRQHAGLN